MKPAVTAVVVNWNSGDDLLRCVASLMAGADRLPLDVVVVDNASSDGSPDVLETFGDAVRLVETGGNIGFGSGVNRGVQRCIAPYVLVLNPDVRVAPDAVERLLDFLKANDRVGVVGPRLVDERGHAQRSFGRAPRLAGEICRKFLLHLVLPFLKFGCRVSSWPTSVGWVTGACFLMRRSAFGAVGGMDDAIFMYYEDVDLCLRLGKAGWSVAYLPEACAFHAGGGSSKRALERMLVEGVASHLYVMKKHLGDRAGRLLAALTFPEMVLRTLLWGGLFLFPGLRREAGPRLRAYKRVLARCITGRVGFGSRWGSAGPEEIS
ncbi:MAG: glycosyltransferase family 2 protein [Gemmatimonadota bacterium]|nr:glycosyltransferase family 2 protein [Gemmatimonadota bacterium]